MILVEGILSVSSQFDSGHFRDVMKNDVGKVDFFSIWALTVSYIEYRIKRV